MQRRRKKSTKEAPTTSSSSKSDDRTNDGRSRQKRIGITSFVLFGFLTLCVVGGYRYLLLWESEEQERIEKHVHGELDPMKLEWEEKVEKLQEENQMLRKRRQQVETPSLKTPTEKTQKQLTQLKAYKQRMHTAIQDMSRRALVEKFGEGPHRVEIQLDFDPQSASPAHLMNADRFVIEMAPIQEMPHTVYTFLEQVDRKLYNGCSFHRNAGHVVQGGPAPNFHTPPQGGHLLQKFKDSGFESVQFQEYSPVFPHIKYTLGYAGRPGGPDFYVSTQDNSKVRGPGGQSSYDDPTEADPCFAKVVEGFEAVDRMHQLPVEKGGYKHLVHNVAIRYMKLLK